MEGQSRQPPTATRSKRKQKLVKGVSVVAVLGAVATLLGVLTGGLDLIDRISALLSPPSPPELGAGLEVRTIDYGVTLGDHLEAMELPSAGVPPHQLSLLGNIVHFDVEIRGFVGRECSLRWSLYDHATGQRVPESWLVDQVAMTIVPEAQSDKVSSQIWVHLPQRDGPFFVRLELYDDKATRLTFVDSAPFGKSP